jgi:hypothetical protein
MDPYRFLDFSARHIIRAWAKRLSKEHASRSIPWTCLSRPLSESTVALVSTAGVALRSQVPFDQEGERRNPWWGDPTHRIIPSTSTEKDVRLYHMHIDRSYGESDLDVVLPMHRLDELASQGGIVGKAAQHHYSIMGYQLQTTVLEKETAPKILEDMLEQGVNAAALIPA